MKTMTLEDVKRLPPLTAEEIAEVRNFRNTDFSDCPIQTPEQMKQFRPWYEVHPQESDLYKVRLKKKTVSIRIDADVLEAFKSKGRGYQTRMNSVLRQAVMDGVV